VIRLGAYVGWISPMFISQEVYPHAGLLFVIGLSCAGVLLGAALGAIIEGAL
jgi:hypothetical protein